MSVSVAGGSGGLVVSRHVGAGRIEGLQEPDESFESLHELTDVGKDDNKSQNVHPNCR